MKVINIQQYYHMIKKWLVGPSISSMIYLLVLQMRKNILKEKQKQGKYLLQSLWFSGSLYEQHTNDAISDYTKGSIV